jgi:lysophospholipase L1-like esterase
VVNCQDFENVEVKPFARVGATAGKGKMGLTSFRIFESCLSSSADALVLMLGTNDAWHGNPALFQEGYTNILLTLRKNFPRSSISLVLPPGGKKGKCASNLEEVIHPAVRKLAQAFALPLITPDFKYSADHVHLSAQGARNVAQAVADALNFVAFDHGVMVS